MSRLDQIEAARGGRFTYRFGGQTFTAPDPVDMPWQVIFACLEAQALPMPEGPVSVRQIRALFEAWSAHYGMASFDEARHLAYLVEHYHDDLAFDLWIIARLDLDEEWRARRWRRLLATIGRLPRHGHYSNAVSNDPEHARLLAKAIAERPSDAPSGPSILEWSPEVAAIAELRDDVRRLGYYVLASGGMKNPPKPDPVPRPVTELDRMVKSATNDARRERHEKLVARLLPHKAKKAE
jgi:hypothetical protein